MAESHAEFDPMSRALAEAFWPGPLTLVLPLKPESPIHELCTAGLPTVGIRVPEGFAGLLISAGYVGQLVGGVFFGWLAEKFGLDAGTLPAGAITLQASGSGDRGAGWLRADPVHLRLAHGGFTLIPGAACAIVDRADLAKKLRPGRPVVRVIASTLQSERYSHLRNHPIASFGLESSKLPRPQPDETLEVALAHVELVAA